MLIKLAIQQINSYMGVPTPAAQDNDQLSAQLKQLATEQASFNAQTAQAYAGDPRAVEHAKQAIDNATKNLEQISKIDKLERSKREDAASEQSSTREAIMRINEQRANNQFAG